MSAHGFIDGRPVTYDETTEEWRFDDTGRPVNDPPPPVVFYPADSEQPAPRVLTLDGREVNCYMDDESLRQVATGEVFMVPPITGVTREQFAEAVRASLAANPIGTRP